MASKEKDPVKECQKLIDQQKPRAALKLLNCLPPSTISSNIEFALLRAWALKDANRSYEANAHLRAVLGSEFATPPQLAKAHHFLGICLMRELPDEALMHFTTSRDLYTELGERPSIAFNIMYIARMHILTGEFETARAHINKAGDLFKTAQLPNPGWKSHIYKITSELAMAQKDILQGIGFIALATITSIRYYGLSTTLGYINRTIDQL